MFVPLWLVWVGGIALVLLTIIVVFFFVILNAVADMFRPQAFISENLGLRPRGRKR